MEKVKTTLKQFVRDWSSDGQAERDACYKPVLEEIQALFPKDQMYVSFPQACGINSFVSIASH